MLYKMNTENSKTNESHRFRITVTGTFGLKNPNKNIALANLSICYTWKNIKSTYNNSKFNIYLLQHGIMNLIWLSE